MNEDELFQATKLAVMEEWGYDDEDMDYDEIESKVNQEARNRISLGQQNH